MVPTSKVAKKRGKADSLKKNAESVGSKRPPKKSVVRQNILKQKKSILKVGTLTAKPSTFKIKNNTQQKKAPASKQVGQNIMTLHTRQARKVSLLSEAKTGKQKQKNPRARSKHSLGLLLLSPYRFPVSAPQLALATARFGGLSFVIIGGLFTLFFANASFTPQAQMASTLLSTSETNSGSTNSSSGTSSSGESSGVSIDCNNPLFYASESCAKIVNKTPNVSFDTSFDSNDHGDLSDNVRVRVKVNYASKVTLAAYYKTQSQQLKIGAMTKISDDTWELHWPTTNFNDGTYTLKAIVENPYGVYEATNSTYVVVENVPLVQTTTASTTSSKTTDSMSTDTAPSIATTESVTTATSTPTPLFASVLKSDVQEASNEFHFEIQTAIGNSIKLYATQKTTGQTTLLGFAYKSSEALWKFRWVSSGFTDGDYVIQAQVIAATAITVSNQITVTKTSSEASLSAVPVPATDLTPQVTIHVQSPSPLAGNIDIKIAVDAAKAIEVYAERPSELTKKFLGNARQIDDGVWMYTWDTTQTPNGDYTLIATVKNTFGNYDGTSTLVKVSNVSTSSLTTKQTEQISVLKSIATSVASTTQIQIATKTSTSSHQIDLTTIVDKQKDKIDDLFQRLAVALRNGDTNQASNIKNELQTLKIQMLGSGDTSVSQELATRIDNFIQDKVARVDQDVKITDKLITERTKEKASQDSDKDGISDYDEVTIYKTNPYSADSDGDGFTDGAEILGGFDPNNSKAQVPIQYESPKDSGIVREDVLSVGSISTVANDNSSSSIPVALLSGKGLPNSFVTLYIFSTPIVVTLKTDDDGSWTYHFDKELEDGQHQVYVGVTDNAGKIVAKSNPFSFIKVAQAYNEVTPKAEPSPVVEQPTKESFLSGYMVYLVLSISVIAIGLVLILLGLHLDAYQRKNIISEATL